MKKNDKIIVILGVVVLILASVGVFYFESGSTGAGKIEADDFLKTSGTFKEPLMGMSATVPDTDPFYALAATPLAVHYDSEGNQEIIPLYVENLTERSETIDELKYRYLEPFEDLKLDELNYEDAEDFSIKIAEKYWKESEAAMVLETNYEGYSLGVNAVPLASYLSIPVIVCDEIDSDVTSLLTKLGVNKLIIVGKGLEGYEESYQYTIFEDADQIVDTLTMVVKEKFGDVEYITLANPIDAYPPKVLDSVEFFFEKTTIPSSTMNDGMLTFISNSGNNAPWDPFTIPSDYKYALIEIYGENHNIEHVKDLGDRAYFILNPTDPEGAILTGGNGIGTSDGHPIKDGAGNIIKDVAYAERVLYDCGGNEYELMTKGKWGADTEGDVSARIVVKKLAHPVYEMMQKHSVMAPYLAANYKGIVFAKEEFNFTADDHVITDEGKTSPGFYMPGRNFELTPMSNRHVFDNIHKPLNKLLANIADVHYQKDSDLGALQKHYSNKPINIAILGGATAIPRYFFDNDVEPIEDEGLYYFGGGGSQSDNIYGNIDPEGYDYSNMANDIYTTYPFQENVVGRISTYDVQDASAAILRSIFYQDILEIQELSVWKENFGNLYGGGLDFKKPFSLWALTSIPGVSFIESMLGGLVDLHGPWKYETGYGEIGALAMNYKVGEKLGFNVELAYDSEGMLEGLSQEAINAVKTKTTRNKIFFDAEAIEEIAGKQNVKAREIIENSNFLFLTAHGAQHNFGMPGPELVTSALKGLFGILNWQKYWTMINPVVGGGFWGPGGDIDKVGEYTPRSIADIDLGPSFLWLESCFLGKINGLYPKAAISPSFMHAGANAIIASTTGSNIPGGYLPEKKFMFDTKLGTKLKYNEWIKKAEDNIFPDFHFGVKVYEDMCQDLDDNDNSIGMAFRNAKNKYLPEDAEWELWWNPPLSSGAPSSYGPQLPAKYTTYHEYVLYGDPAFNPYVPGE